MKTGRKLEALCKELGLENYTDYGSLDYGRFYKSDNEKYISPKSLKYDIEEIKDKINELIERVNKHNSKLKAIMNYLKIEICEGGEVKKVAKNKTKQI